MFRATTRITTPLIAGALAFGLFPIRKSTFDTYKNTSNETITNQIKSNPLYKSLALDSNFTMETSRAQFPKQHHENLVTLGLLYGKNLFEIDPIIFSNNKDQLYAFHYLGNQLVSEDGKIHNGITSTILDEGLCAAGFPLLPTKKGVTAKLSIDFKNQAPANSPVVLKAHVIEQKGRKVVIEGSLETLNDATTTTATATATATTVAPPVTIATAKCILVEPKWFKYISWFLVI